jgi:autotransporter-associated beta strand protein
MQKPSTPRHLAKWVIPSLALFVAANSIHAQTANASVWLGTTSTNWNEATNWSPTGVPSAVNAGIDGTAANAPIITSAVPDVAQLLINGGTATSSVVIDAGGSLTAAGNGGNTGLFVGANGSSGLFTVQNGGSFTLTGGDFGVGRGVGASVLTLKDTGSSINVSNVNEFQIGWDGGGDGTINQTGGTFNFTAGGDLRIGAFGGTGHYNLSGATSVANFRNTRIGYGGGTGTLTQSEGTINQTGSDFAVGWGGGSGTYQMDGGTMNASRFRVAVGDATTGTVIQTGGTVNISDTLDVGEAGSGGPSTGEYRMQGGTLNMTANWMRIGFGDTGSVGTFTQTGGTVITDGDHGVIVADNPNAVGNLNLNGGVFQAGKIQKGGGNGSLTINGGTLKPVHDEGNFIAPGFTVVTIGTNGATFDTAGFDTGVQSPLTGPGGITKIGGNQLKLGSVNTYTGNTVINAGVFTIEDNGSLLFSINASGVNNQITGNGTGNLNLFGHFAFDLTNAAPVGSWTIINLAGIAGGAANFGANFSVTGWTDNGDNTWSFGNYTFSETTGILTAVPEPSTVALLCVSLGFGLSTVARRRRRLN